MEHERTRLRVLARIPKIGGTGSESGDLATLPEEDGRLISQTVAFRLLAATALLLLVVAVIPFSRSESGPKPAVTGVSSTPSPAADVLSWTPVAERASRKAAEDGSQMSIWPSPDHPSSPEVEGRAEGLPPAGNRPPTTREPQYQADARAGH
jgi:hypothetical protein